MPITWRNIDIANRGASNALIAHSADKITEGISGLGDVVNDLNKTKADNWAQGIKVNTENALSKLPEITDSKSLLDAIQGNGVLSAQTLRSQSGAQIDLNKVTSAVMNRQDALSRTETDMEIRAQDREDTRQQRLLGNDRWKAQFKLAQETANRNQENHQAASDAKAEHLHKQDNVRRLEQIVHNTIKGSDSVTDVDESLLHIQANLADYDINTMDAGEAASVIKRTFDVYKASSSDPAYSTGTAINNADLDNATNDVTKRYEDWRTNYISQADKATVTLISDVTPEGDVMRELNTYLHGKNIIDEDTDETTPPYLKVKDFFTARGHKNVSPAFVKDVIMSHGFEDELWGTNSFSDPNNSYLQKRLDDLKEAKKFAPGGEKHKVLLEQEQKQLQRLASLQSAHKNVQDMYTTALWTKTKNAASIGSSVAFAEPNSTAGYKEASTLRDSLGNVISLESSPIRKQLARFQVDMDLLPKVEIPVVQQDTQKLKEQAAKKNALMYGIFPAASIFNLID